MFSQVCLFDDSFEHEVWNATDEPRLVLIVDMWHPRLKAHEERVAALDADRAIRYTRLVRSRIFESHPGSSDHQSTATAPSVPRASLGPARTPVRSPTEVMTGVPSATRIPGGVAHLCAGLHDASLGGTDGVRYLIACLDSYLTNSQCSQSSGSFSEISETSTYDTDVVLASQLAQMLRSLLPPDATPVALALPVTTPVHPAASLPIAVPMSTAVLAPAVTSGPLTTLTTVTMLASVATSVLTTPQEGVSHPTATSCAVRALATRTPEVVAEAAVGSVAESVAEVVGGRDIAPCNFPRHTLSADDFCRFGRRFAARSVAHALSWAWVEPMSVGCRGFAALPCGYLAASPLLLDKEPGHQCPNGHTTVGQLGTGDCVSMGAFIEEEDDDSAAPSSKPAARLMLHVIHSASYSVPMLLLQGYGSDGTLWTPQDVRAHLEARRGPNHTVPQPQWAIAHAISQVEHPVLHTPWCCVDPCETAALMGKLMGAADAAVADAAAVVEAIAEAKAGGGRRAAKAEGAPLDYLSAWWSVVAPLVGAPSRAAWHYHPHTM